MIGGYMTKSLGQSLREQVQNALDQANYHKQEAMLLEEALISVKDALAEDDNGHVVVGATVAARTIGKEEKDAKALVFSLLKRDEANVAELAVAMKEFGYKTTLDDSDFIQYIMDNCIDPLVQEGKIGMTKDKKYKRK